MYSSNLFNLIEDFWDKEAKKLVIDFENDVSGCFITHDGEVVNDMIRKHYGLGGEQ
jgi:NAD(P) transhydrogenase subunit alpha